MLAERMSPGNAILIVAADPVLLEQFHARLPRGWTIDTCDDNECALRKVREHGYDLVVTSIATSTAEDIELLRDIRQVRPHTKLIILTGQSTPGDVIHALREHAFGYFSMPIDTSVLFDLIQAAIKAPSWDDGIEVISARPGWVSVRARCTPMTAERLQLFFREMKIQLPATVRDQLGVAFREILMNAIEHGAGLDASKYVDIVCARTSRAIIYFLRDPGPGFSLESLPHSALTNPEDDPTQHMRVRSEQGLRAGGFGLLMARNLVDEMIYNERGNEVLLIKYITDECRDSSLAQAG